MENKISNLFCSKETSLKEVLDKFDKASTYNLPSGIALFVNNHKSLIGVISQGDIRRALLKDTSLEEKAYKYMIDSPITFNSSDSLSIILEKLPEELNIRNRKSSKFLDKIILVDDKNTPIRIIGYHELWEQKVAIHRNISIIGMGYVGLTLALVMADSGFNITGIESNKKTLNLLKKGESHIFENGLLELLNENLNRNLIFEKEVDTSDVFIISVGTPIFCNSDEEMVPNMDYLEGASFSVGRKLSVGNLVVLRSTVPVGTTRNFVKDILEKESGLVCGIDFHLSFAPERTAEGSAIKELRSLPQIIGGFNQDSIRVTSAIFRDITSTIVTVTSLEEAEMVKLINNSFRDYIFAFSNHIAKIASKYNINAHRLINSSNKGYIRDPIPYPSPGVGGPCLTKDPYIFSFVTDQHSINHKLFLNGRKVNESMHNFVYEQFMKALKLAGKEGKKNKILFCGLAFKGNPETGDIRNSSSVEIIKIFLKHNYDLYGYDAVASSEEIESIGLSYHDINSGFDEFDAVLFLNNHTKFQKINPFNMVSNMKEKPIIFDGWDLFQEKEILSVKPSIYLGLSNILSSIKGIKV
tara:strand:+ start:2407 stop:4155 length:1749 start_codon:yes stop_codon:yes gene_type:complete